MFTLRDLIKNFYPSQYLSIYIMSGEKFDTTKEYIEELYPIYLDFYVRTIEIYRDELGKLKDILKIIISKD